MTITQLCACPLSGQVRAIAVQLLSRVTAPWTVAHQAPLSMEFSRQEYWSGLWFPSLGDLPDPGIKLRSPALQADSLPAEPSRKPNKYHRKILKPLSLPLSHGDVPSVSIRVTMLKTKYLKRLNSNKNGKSRQVVKAPGSRVQCWTKACRDHLSYFYRKSSWPLPGCDVELILQEFQLFR